MTCPALVRNSGNMRMSAVSILGSSNNCSALLMAPQEVMSCIMWRNLTAADFEASIFVVTASGVTAEPKGLRALQPFLPVTGVVSNPNVSTALLSVSVIANTSVVTAAGQEVMYTITLVRPVGGC